MTESSNDRSPRDRQVDALIAEFELAAEQGRPLDPEEFLKQHAEYAPELREYFEDAGRMDAAVQPYRPEPEETEPVPGSEPGTLKKGMTVRYFGDYEILEELGSGGMGVVYKARQKKLKRLVALKMIKRGQFASEEEVGRFQAEARAAAKLDHPGIVGLIEVGLHHGEHYFAMDYVAGGSLSALYREQPVAARRAAELVKKLAEAMQHAHDQGIVHRDLKPANVLLTTTGTPRITDFGLAKRLSSDDDSTGVTMTQTGQVLGTAGYMSPEQAAGKTGTVNTPTDIYSLGAILYALLTSRAPFVGDSPSVTILQVLNNEPVALRTLNPSVPRDLETICLRCLEKEPHKRYGTAQLLADDLTRFLENKPVLARPITAVERSWRWCRRNPWAATALALLVAISLISPSVAYREFWQSQRIKSYVHQITDLLETTKVGAGRARTAEREARRAQAVAEEAAARERRGRFASEMNLIPFHWELGNQVEMQRLLDAQIPQGQDEDLREFTWRHWSHVLKSQHVSAPAKLPVPIAVRTVFSSDGLRVAFATSQGPIYVRRVDAAPDAPDEFKLPVPGKFPYITDLAFVEDSNTLAVGDFHQITLWNLSHKRPESTIAFGGDAKRFQGLPENGAFSSNGRFFARVDNAADNAAKVYRVWDLVKKTSVAGMPYVPGKFIRSVHVNDEGTRLLTNTGTVWNVPDQREEYSISLWQNSWEARFAPNGEDIIAIDASRRLSLWNRKGGERLLAKKVGPFAISNVRNEVCWATPRGVHVLSLAEQGSERFIHARGINTLRFVPGDKHLVGLDIHNLHRWPLDIADPSDPKILEKWNGKGYGKLSARGTYFAFCNLSEVSIWETVSGKLINRFNAIGERTGNQFRDSNSGVRSYAVTDSGLIVTCGDQGTARVWDGIKGELVETLRQSPKPANEVETINQSLFAVTVSENGNLVVATRLDGSVTIWNRNEKSERLLAVKTHFTNPPILVPGGQLLRTLNKADHKFATWDTSTLQPVPANTRMGWFFLRDRWVGSESDADGTIWLCDIQTGKRFQRLGVHAGASARTATPDGKNIATLSNDGSLIIWDARQSTPLFPVDVDGGIGQLTFIEEGKSLALVLSDGRIRYWRTAAP